MIRQNHIAVAQCTMTACVYAAHVKPLIAIPLLCGSYFGSDFPDIDHPKNHLNITLQRLHLGWLLPKKHRGLYHTIWPVIALSFLTYFLFKHATSNFEHVCAIFLFGFTFGYLIHLIIDNFSYQGVLWLYPFTHWQVSNTGHFYKARHRNRVIPWEFSKKGLYRTNGTFELYFGLFCRICWYLLTIKWFLLMY